MLDFHQDSTSVGMVLRNVDSIKKGIWPNIATECHLTCCNIWAAFIMRECIVF